MLALQIELSERFWASGWLMLSTGQTSTDAVSYVEASWGFAVSCHVQAHCMMSIVRTKCVVPMVLVIQSCSKQLAPAEAVNPAPSPLTPP